MTLVQVQRKVKYLNFRSGASLNAARDENFCPPPRLNINFLKILSQLYGISRAQHWAIVLKNTFIDTAAQNV
jgi:hypothetical protein